MAHVAGGFIASVVSSASADAYSFNPLPEYCGLCGFDKDNREIFLANFLH
jgi:hypothetical protein